jgi:hypothetical protein
VATDALILQALSSEGWPQERQEPVAARVSREGFDVDAVWGVRIAQMKRSCARSPGGVLAAWARGPYQPLTGEQPEER